MMSWSLQLNNGDLSYGTNGFDTVAGSAKLVQDLRCALLEPMGNDPLHPTLGSVIDGGVDSQGNTVPGVIGAGNNSSSATFVSAEVQRVCRNHQAHQIARNQTDVATYGKSTLTADEALLSVVNVSTQAVEDQLMVIATLRTGVGDLPLIVPFSTI